MVLVSLRLPMAALWNTVLSIISLRLISPVPPSLMSMICCSTADFPIPRTMVIRVTEIMIATREGKMIAKPFQVNDVASAIAEQEENTNSPGEVQEENKDTKLPENIADD